MSRSKEYKKSNQTRKRARTHSEDDNDDVNEASSDTDTAKWSDDDFDNTSDDETPKTPRHKSKSKSKKLAKSKRRDEAKPTREKRERKKASDSEKTSRPKKRARPNTSRDDDKETKDEKQSSVSGLEKDAKDGKEEAVTETEEEKKAINDALAKSRAEMTKAYFRTELIQFITNSATDVALANDKNAKTIGAVDKTKIEEDVDCVLNTGVRISLILAMRMAQDEEKQACLELARTRPNTTSPLEQKTSAIIKTSQCKGDCLFLSLGSDMASKYILFNGVWTCVGFVETLAQKQSTTPPIYPGTSIQLLRLMRRNQNGHGSLKTDKTACQRSWIMMLHRMVGHLADFYIKTSVDGGICTCRGEHDEIEKAIHVILGA